MILDDYFSIAITPLAIITCFHLIYHWYPRALAFIKGNREALSYIGLGVVIYHAGTVLDNAYWDSAWTSLISDHWLKPYFFDYGSMANVVFRQGCVIVGGYLQIVGVMMYDNNRAGMNKFYSHSAAALLLGIAHVAWLYY